MAFQNESVLIGLSQTDDGFAADEDWVWNFIGSAEENPPGNIVASIEDSLWAEGQPDDAGHELDPPEFEDLGFLYFAGSRDLSGLADGTHSIGEGNWQGKVMCQYGQSESEKAPDH